jgi:single-stranded DNA-binding protein
MNMNLCVIAGRIVRNASVKGTDRKIVRFTVETRDGHDEGETKERINQVPCVLFNPSPDLEKTLTGGGEGLRVELQGRVASWGGETNGGKSNVEVMVFNRSLTFVED